MHREIDPATVAVIRGYLEATSREMGVALTRNAASPIFIEGQDFSCAILDARRELIAAANYDPSHLCSMAFAADWAVMELGDRIGVNDVIVQNDPYRGGTHVPDVTMFAPVAVDGELVAYVVTRAHHLDVGGMSPGSVPSGARDVFAEGLRIPPTHWERDGEEVAQTVDWVMTNVRLPDVELSDFRAQVASLRTGQQRIRDLCTRYGVPVVANAMEAVKDQSERHMRAFITSIPDGTYHGADLMDGDGNTSYRYRIEAHVTIAGDEATIDFTGSSLQAEGSINLPFASTASAVYSGMIPLAGTEIAFNHGCFRPLRFVAPRGSIVNAQPPAPTFGCTTDAPLHVIEAMLDALSHAIPDRIIAGSYATCNVIAGSGEQAGEPFLFWFFYEGGWGAAGWRDGWNCTPNQSANFCDYPAEIIESAYPVRCDVIELLPGSGGAGRRRGGFGTAHEYTFLAQTTLSGFGDRHELPPAGRLGGEPGAPSRFLLRRAGEDRWIGIEEATGNPSKFANLIMEPGDALRVENGGGGGYGPPTERDRAAAEQDAADGLAERVLLAPRPSNVDLPARGAAPADALAARARAVVDPLAESVCRTTCPLKADPLQCPYHHPHALAFWPASTLRTWTRRNCQLAGRLADL